MDQFRQKWKSDIDNSPKALCYRLFKENLEFEEYLDLLSDKDKITFCRFRTGNHRLPIETGRWQGTERRNCFCELCNCEDIGDEFHYILKCRALLDERKNCLKPYYLRRVNVLKFGTLFQSKNIHLLKNLCKFIRKINSEVSLPG